MMKEKLTVIKVGGKIVEEEATLNQLLADFSAIEGYKVLFRRLKVAKQQRPLLANKTDEELMTFIQEALEKRLPYYSKAKYVFNGELLENRHQIQQSVERLKDLLKL